MATKWDLDDSDLEGLDADLKMMIHLPDDEMMVTQDSVYSTNKPEPETDSSDSVYSTNKPKPEPDCGETESSDSVYSTNKLMIVDLGPTDDCEETESSDSDNADDQALAPGGYDYQFLRRFKKIEDEDLVCPICQLVSRDPQQSECCGKVFCKVCVERLKGSTLGELSCPCCRKSSVSFFADQRSGRAILSLKVYCERKEKGCDWQGTLQEAKKHPESCDYQCVTCSNYCGKKLHRHKMAKHLKSFCPKRLFRCGDCKEEGQWVYITGEHVKKCPDRFIACDNEGCGQMVKRRHFDDHQLSCPKKVVHCSYRDLGCTATCKREDLATHERESLSQHFNRAVSVAMGLVPPEKDHLLQVVPCVLRIHSFSQSDELKSLPFLLKGYKMCLLVKKEQYQSVSFWMCRMHGSYDTGLPHLRGKITLCVLNQKKDKNHHEISTHIQPRTFYKQFSNFSSSDFPEVVIGRMHGSLLFSEQKGYLCKDTSCIRVSFDQLVKKPLKILK